MHALTHLVHGAGQGEVPVLAVHVVRAGAGVVAEPDAVVLDDASVLLRQLFRKQGANNRKRINKKSSSSRPRLGVPRARVRATNRCELTAIPLAAAAAARLVPHGPSAQPYLDDVEDLPGGLLHLAHLVHEVPELGCAGHLVGREDLFFRE